MNSLSKKNVLAIIPARGGSKGILNKNLRELKGKPLIQYSIEAAKASDFINKIVVSTDSDEIAAKAKDLGAEVIVRPSHMAADQSLVIESIRYTIKQCEISGFDPEVIALLECTSPIKSKQDIDLAIKKLLDKEADSAATFKETHVSPHRVWKIQDGEVKAYINDASPFLPRQSQPKAYELTGQVYAFTKIILENNPGSISILLGKIFPIISTVSVDIDHEIDLSIAEGILSYLENEKTKRIIGS